MLRFPQVFDLVRLSRGTVDALERAGRFPKRLQLTGGRAVGWLESDIQKHIEKLARKR